MATATAMATSGITITATTAPFTSTEAITITATDAEAVTGVPPPPLEGRRP